VNSSALFATEKGSYRIRFVDLYDVLPNVGAVTQSTVKLAPMGNPLSGQVVVFEEKVSWCFLIFFFLFLRELSGKK